MGDISVNIEALEQCRIEVTGQTGPMAAAADGLPKDVGADGLGGLDGADALAGAVNSLSQIADGEIDKGSGKLDQIGAALDAVIATVKDTEQHNAQSLTPR